MQTVEIIFYILLIDAVIANILSWFGQRWYIRHFRTLSRIFPASRAWTVLYLVLVIFIGYLI